MKIHNFSAGPSILPQQVFEKAAQSLIDFNGMGLSILEISHRSKDFVAVMEESRQLVKNLMGLDERYEVLFLAGGASLQFLMTPMNLLKEKEGKAGYLETGTWAEGAIKEAKKLGTVEIAASSKADNYSYIPTEYTISEDWDYFHVTSNNTIYGTQMQSFPESSVPLVCDMSSDIFSRAIDFSQFDLIYAGAQKNIGPAGVTLVVVNKEVLGKTGRDLPSYLNYELHIAKDSMFNTPPVFNVYTTLLTLKALVENGGIEEAEKRNKAKASLLYDAIDQLPEFKAVARKDSRSLMNVTFDLVDSSLKETFDARCKEAGISGLAGHRSVGGYRASIYNAMPIESVEVLVSVMNQLK